MKLVVVSIFVLVVSACELPNKPGSFDNKTLVKSTHQETKISLQQQEQMYPENFVKLIEGTYRKNFVNDWIVRGTIRNSATVATYKDITIDIAFYTKTNTYIGTIQRTIQEYFPPNSIRKFKYQLGNYSKAKLVKMQISSIRNSE